MKPEIPSTATSRQTSIGIIGAGNIGRAIAEALARNGIAATISNSRGPESLSDLVAALGPTITAGTREQAATKDMVFVAVNWSKLPAALAGLPNFAGRIVIDANNPIEAPLFSPPSSLDVRPRRSWPAWFRVRGRSRRSTIYSRRC